jgi:hypothetical protein
MTTFFLDLWHDLREKRLWPVAVALLAGILAVPVLLFKPAGQEPPLEGSTATGAAERLPVVSLEDGPTRGSALDAFDPKDPFRPFTDRPDVPGAGGDSGSGSDSIVGGDVAGGGSGSGSGDTGSGGSTGGGSTGGGSAGGGSGSGGGGGVQYFTFSVDIKFGKRGDEETRRNVHQLDLLPDSNDPLLVFMGVTQDATSAVFLLVDPGFESDGEGECRPDPDNCEFVYLGIDEDRDEQTYAMRDGSAEYNLQLLSINRENVSRDEAVGDSEPPRSERRSERRNKSRPRSLLDYSLFRLMR